MTRATLSSCSSFLMLVGGVPSPVSGVIKDGLLWLHMFGSIHSSGFASARTL